MYYVYLNILPFKYYISILGGVGGLSPCLFCLFREGGGPEFRKTCLYNTCTLPYVENTRGGEGDIFLEISFFVFPILDY